MTYLALLRGINVGGKNRVEMSRLKTAFGSLGFQAVQTYINSGNVIFNAPQQDEGLLAQTIERQLQKEFGFSVRVVVKDKPTIQKISRALPKTWLNNADMKCDVMFLWAEVNTKDILKELPVKPELEDVRYVAGALLWRIDRVHVGKSRMLKLVGTTLYSNMTIRNCNTVRKLAAMMD